MAPASQQNSRAGNRINHRWVSSESTHHERFRVCRSSESERKRPMTRGLSASVRCEWHHQPAPSARRTFDLLIRFLVGGAACCKLSASFVLGCSFVAPFPNGTAVLWWDAKHHSKSPIVLPSLCFRGNSLLPSGRPSSLSSSHFHLMAFSSVLFSSHFCFFRYCFSFFAKTSF